MLGGTMAIDWGPSREVLWWFETDYVVKIRCKIIRSSSYLGLSGHGL